VSRRPSNPAGRRRRHAACRIGLLLAFAAMFPLLGGCGLGTVAIVVAVLSSGGDDGGGEPTPAFPAPTILFYEDFENDLGQWRAAGSSPPFLDPQGEEGSGLAPGGTTTENGEVVTRYAFDLDPGVTARASMRVPLLGAANSDLWFGFKNSYAPDASPDFLTGFFLSSSQSQVKMYVGGVVDGVRALSETGWKRYEIYVRPDGRAEFYIDGGLVHVSVQKVDPLPDARPLTAGGKNLGADTRMDEVEVFGYEPVREIFFADSFGTDLSAWTVSATSGSNPAIDPFVEGHPSPALNPGGDASGTGEAETPETFLFTTSGLEIDADLYVSALGADTAQAWAGLADASGTPGALSLAAGVALSPSTVSDEIRYILNGAQVHAETLAAPGWYAFRVMIRPAGAGWRVEYHRDGSLVFASATDLLMTHDDSPLSVGGRSAGTNARVDNVAVLTPPAFQAPAWTGLTDTGSGPAADIEGHVLVWDGEEDRAIALFGGSGLSASADVYALETSEDQAVWSKLSPDTSAGVPLARVHASGSYCRWACSVYAVMGGTSGTGGTLHDDVWKLDFTSGSEGAWTLEASGSGPSARYGHSVVADPVGKRLLLFGGEDAGDVTADLYAFDTESAGWTALSPSGGPPSARRFHAAVLDGANRRMIVYGGEDASGVAVADDLWALDLTADPPAWTALTPAGAGPSARSRCAASVARLKRRLYVFGGRDSVTAYQEMFALDLAGGEDGVWSCELLANPVGTFHDSPENSGMIFDPLRERFLLVGGTGGNAPTASEASLKGEE